MFSGFVRKQMKKQVEKNNTNNISWDDFEQKYIFIENKFEASHFF
jgi:hypothetical protein